MKNVFNAMGIPVKVLKGKSALPQGTALHIALQGDNEKQDRQKHEIISFFQFFLLQFLSNGKRKSLRNASLWHKSEGIRNWNKRMRLKYCHAWMWFKAF